MTNRAQVVVILQFHADVCLLCSRSVRSEWSDQNLPLVKAGGLYFRKNDLQKI